MHAIVGLVVHYMYAYSVVVSGDGVIVVCVFLFF